MDRKSRNSVLLADQITLPVEELRRLVAYHVIFSRAIMHVNGIECVFLPLNSKIGLKIYPYKHERDKAYDSQKVFYKKGVAPAVGQKIDLSLPEMHRDDPDMSFARDIPQYGYTTQIAEKYPWDKDRRAGLKDLPKKDRNRFIKSGLPLWDLHEDNIGIVDDKIVFLDFGVATCPPKRKCKNKK